VATLLFDLFGINTKIVAAKKEGIILQLFLQPLSFLIYYPGLAETVQ
jgi:hypothetical protein